MKVPFLVFCALLVIANAEVQQEGDVRGHSLTLTPPHRYSPSSLTDCDVTKISGDLHSIVSYTYNMVTDSVWDLVDIAGNLIFCANSMLNWLCPGSDDWESRVEAHWSQLQQVVSQFLQEVPDLWQEVLEEIESCL